MNIRRIAAACLLSMALTASVSAQTVDNIIIIDGHFFSTMPVSASGITGVGPITTLNGTKALVLTLDSPLPVEALKYELPADSIPEAEELLECAKTVKIRSTFVAKPSNELISVGTKFPAFKAKDIDGRSWTNTDVEGKPMVLNLWYTGCGPCRAEMPELSTWKDEMPDVMFFSATYEDAKRARPVLEQQRFNWIHLVGDKQFCKWIDSTGYPLTLVVDKSGVIVHIEHGTSPVQREVLKKKIQEAR